MASDESELPKKSEKVEAENEHNAGFQSIAASTWASKALETGNNQSSKASSSLPELSITNSAKDNNLIAGMLQNESGSIVKDFKNLLSLAKNSENNCKHELSSKMVDNLKDFLNSSNGIEWKKHQNEKPTDNDARNGSQNGGTDGRGQNQNGTRPENNADDRNRTRPADGGEGRDRTERPQVQLNEREQRLYDQMAARGASAQDLRTFREDLVTLRNRGLSEQEVSRTLDQVERLMNSRGDQPVSQNERRNIAMQIVHHAARPTEIDQGNHMTCNVTTVQERLFTRTPSKAAEMIVTAATTGSWTAPDGTRITLDARSFVPGAEERRPYPNDGERSHASQIFQIVAANDITQRRNPPQFYRQETPTGGNDTGERLVYANGNPVMETVNGRQQRVTHPNITVDDMAAQGRRLTGDTGYILLHSDYAAGPGLRQVGTQEQLVTAVQDLERRGQLPATVYIDAGHPSFLNDNAHGHQAHVVTITGYDARTGMFRISNQWGSGSDINISAANLLQAMQPPRQQRPPREERRKS